MSIAGVAIIFGVAVRILLGPMFHSWSAYGFHDWDAHSAYIYVTVVGIKRYHVLPWWNPWLGGGFPAWAYVEGATNLVSPYLPLYLAFPIQVAERLEVVGSTLMSLVSTYLLAGRVTRSAALRTLVAVVYAINGRWALQLATGHMWHLQYAWLPLVLYLFDLSVDSGKLKYAVFSGAAMAMIAFMGGIYPLPHTALLLVVYGALLALTRRSWRPIGALAITSVCAIGFSAPKLFPMIDLMLRYPRKIDSPEFIDLGQLMAMLTDPNQSYWQAPVAVAHWGWHEYGLYVGIWPTLAMVVGFVDARGKKLVALKGAGLIFLLLGMGSFHPRAPWPLLHQMPVFWSQHVPTRFLFPAVLLLMLSFAAFAGRLLDKRLAIRPWIDVLLLVPAYFVAVNIASVGKKTTEHSFYMEAPHITPSPEFHHVSACPYNYMPGDWAGAGLLAMYANMGHVGSYGLPAFTPGAIEVGTPGYKGEAYFVGPVQPTGGSARVTDWTPNGAEIEYDHAPAGALLVYNMNYDPSWRANGRPAVEYEHAVATPVREGAGRIKFTYYPRTLNWGLFAFALTLFSAVGSKKVWKRLPATTTSRARSASLPEVALA